MITRLTCFVWQPSINCCGASTCCVVGLCHLKPFWLFLSCELRTLWVLLRKTRLYSFAGMDIRAISLWLFRKARSLFFSMRIKTLKCHSGGSEPDKCTPFSTSSNSSCSSGNFSDSAVTWSHPGPWPVQSAVTAESSSSLEMGPCSNWGGDWKTGLQWKDVVVALESVGDKRFSKWFLQPWSRSVGVSAEMIPCALTFLPVSVLIRC